MILYELAILGDLIGKLLARLGRLRGQTVDKIGRADYYRRVAANRRGLSRE